MCYIRLKCNFVKPYNGPKSELGHEDMFLVSKYFNFTVIMSNCKKFVQKCVGVRIEMRKVSKKFS